MALPKLEVPTYELELPLSKKKIKYRPYLIKEQKSLMMAMESSDASTIQHNVREILNVCTLSKDVDIDELPIIDIEYYFLQLRGKSVGEISESKYRCNNEIAEDKLCGNVMESKIDVTTIEPEFDGDPVDPEIQITDKITVKMKYPPFKLIKDSVELDDITEVTFHMIANSIDYVYDGEQFHYAKETTKEELIQFVETMNQQQFEKVEHFFNNVPRLKKKVEIVCSKCGFNHSLEVEGLESFFGL
jgi:hypothetical protein